MSLYARYLKERTNDLIIETEQGFGTYRYVDERTVYIVDIYVIPHARKLRVATEIADKIVEEAKYMGRSRLIGSVVPSCKGSTESLQVLLGYGMRLDSCAADFILFSKEIA